MTTRKGKLTAKLGLNKLLQSLRSGKTAAVVGGALSEEIGIPQFEAILNGVWSGTPKNVDPFGNGNGRESVLGWFGWRMHLIRKKSYGPCFQVIRELKTVLSLSIVASQAVDGQLRLGGMHDVLELYGNIFEGRCSRCGIAVPSLSPEMMCPGHHPICDACGGYVFPDVSMFGWNQKTETQNQVKAILAKADTVILIGADLSLAPFNDRDSLDACRYNVLEVLPKELRLSDASTVLRATPKALSDEFEKQYGQTFPAPNSSSLRSNLEYLAGLVRTLEELGAPPMGTGANSDFQPKANTGHR